VIQRGRARVTLGADVHELGPGDVVYVEGSDLACFEALGDEPLGFICVRRRLAGSETRAWPSRVQRGRIGGSNERRRDGADHSLGSLRARAGAGSGLTSRADGSLDRLACARVRVG
jgi:hypothetical protein